MRNLKKAAACGLSVVFILCGVSTHAQAEPGKAIVCFYSSESNINNFRSLKMEFDRYLEDLGPYGFQPFSKRKSFEASLRNRKNNLILLSSWHFSRIYKEYNLKPVLIGTRKGRTTEKKVLVASVSVQSTGNALKNLASAGSDSYTESVLNHMIKNGNNLNFTKILKVPKDMDALMSVAFGISTSAVATEWSLNRLKLINPNLCARMRIIAKGDEALLLIAAVPEDCTKSVGALLKITEHMCENAGGRKKIEMLGVDCFMPISSSDRNKLEIDNRRLINKGR